MVMAESTYENASGLMFVSLFVPYVYKFVIFLIVQDRKKNLDFSLVFQYITNAVFKKIMHVWIIQNIPVWKWDIDFIANMQNYHSLQVQAITINLFLDNFVNGWWKMCSWHCCWIVFVAGHGDINVCNCLKSLLVWLLIRIIQLRPPSADH